jgi:hypothetical protein
MWGAPRRIAFGTRDAKKTPKGQQGDEMLNGT